MHCYEPPWGVEQTRCEHRVADDLVSMLGHERKSLSVRHGFAEIVDEVRDFVAVIAKRG